ncbi:MAG: hypothetical protein DME33_00555 [Verrucomicrobia bacterium]|nr:MAG: hypothetical protein DME33_00555 [Verrucomicrobiota bacterium]
MQVASDLDVADEAGIELHLRPCGAVIGVGDVESAAPNVEVVIGDIHPPVEGADRVVIDPHALAVITAAVMRARPGGPSDAVGGGPEADALPATASRQIAGEPHAQARVVHHDRVAVVGAVAGAEGLASVPGRAVIGRIRKTGVAAARCAAVVVADDPGVVRASPFHGLRLGHFGIAAVREDDINVGAADEQGCRQQIVDQSGECGAA